jgi:hypothetical protein
MLGTIGVKGIKAMTNSPLFALGTTTASLATGFATSWVCNKFTPESNLNTARDILNQVKKTINQPELKSILEFENNTINYQHVKFLHTRLNPMQQDIQKANNLISSIESHMFTNFGFFNQDVISKAVFNNSVKNLKEDIEKHKTKIDKACDTIETHELFPSINKSYISANSALLKQEKNTEQIIILKEKNSYITRFFIMLNSLLANPFIKNYLLNMMGIGIVV